MSDQHEQDHEAGDVVPVEVADTGSTHPDDVAQLDEDLKVEDADPAPEDPDPAPDAVDEDHVDDHDVDGGEAASDSTDPAVPVERANANDLRDEQYERAKVDPEFAVQNAILVPEEDQGPAWEHGSLADYERTQALEAQVAEDDDTDEEV